MELDKAICEWIWLIIILGWLLGSIIIVIFAFKAKNKNIPMFIFFGVSLFVVFLFAMTRIVFNTDFKDNYFKLYVTFEVLNDISMAFITAFLFYFFSEYLPKKRKFNIAMKQAKDKIEEIFKDITKIIAIYEFCAKADDYREDLINQTCVIKTNQYGTEFEDPISLEDYLVRIYINDEYKGKDVINFKDVLKVNIKNIYTNIESISNFKYFDSLDDEIIYYLFLLKENEFFKYNDEDFDYFYLLNSEKTYLNMKEFKEIGKFLSKAFKINYKYKVEGTNIMELINHNINCCNHPVDNHLATFIDTYGLVIDINLNKKEKK